MQLRKLGRIPTASRRGIQCFLTGVGNIHLEVPTLTPLEGDWDDRVDGDGDEMDLAARVADIAQKDTVGDVHTAKYFTTISRRTCL